MINAYKGQHLFWASLVFEGLLQVYAFPSQLQRGAFLKEHFASSVAISSPQALHILQENNRNKLYWNPNTFRVHKEA